MEQCNRFGWMSSTCIGLRGSPLKKGHPSSLSTGMQLTDVVNVIITVNIRFLVCVTSMATFAVSVYGVSLWV